MSGAGDAPRPVRVSGAEPGAGHYAEFIANPAAFMLRAWRECGELAEFDLRGARNVLMVGPDAHEAVFRAPDDQLSAAEPYKYMVSVFGEGIQYGAPLQIERQQVKFLTHALRPEKMKGYARVIAREVEDFIADWGDEGERDFYEAWKELVLRGRRKRVGNAFALLQVQSIFCALLARYDFEPVDPPESYRDVMPSLILRPSEPCRLRYRKRRRPGQS